MMVICEDQKEQEKINTMNKDSKVEGKEPVTPFLRCLLSTICMSKHIQTLIYMCVSISM